MLLGKGLVHHWEGPRDSLIILISGHTSESPGIHENNKNWTLQANLDPDGMGIRLTWKTGENTDSWAHPQSLSGSGMGREILHF